MAKRFAYRLDIATAPGMTADESQRCLRAMLKAMLRQWDIKCIGAMPIEPADDAQDTPQRTKGSQGDE
ncbi:MAG TPA: hypothetical protein DDZ51_05820 [Planctomycetaceae bacterium]|nr:hypothetical protein [Planctomycetaceae bacterium]